MTAHDPLCLYVGDGPCRWCFRLETARAEARADERAKWESRWRRAAEQRNAAREELAEVRERIAVAKVRARNGERERIAKTWQVNGWTVLMPAVAEAKKRGGNVIIAAAQTVTDWLREGGDADDWADWDAIAKTEGDMFAIRDLVKDAIHDAARIARGEQP